MITIMMMMMIYGDHNDYNDDDDADDDAGDDDFSAKIFRALWKPNLKSHLSAGWCLH